MRYETAFKLESLKSGDLLIVSRMQDIRPTLEFVFRDKETIILVMGGHTASDYINRFGLQPFPKPYRIPHAVTVHADWLEQHPAFKTIWHGRAEEASRRAALELQGISWEESDLLETNWYTQRHAFVFKQIPSIGKMLLAGKKKIDFLVIDHFPSLQKLNPAMDVLFELEMLAAELNTVMVIILPFSIAAGLR